MRKQDKIMMTFFLRIGHFAQHLSIIAAKYGMAARGIKKLQ
ncbi:hypothetical protein OL548_29300 [Lysinibacillus sp. MHQ-1]|nr:hypothetical protein OL548_29300 [Lysinibacillus sp. MHQ-1]